MRNLVVLLLLFAGLSITAQKIDRVEPPNWWTGMKNQKLEILVYGNNIGSFTPSITENDVTLLKITKAPNHNYVFLLVDLSSATSGTFTIEFSDRNSKVVSSVPYELKARKKDSKDRNGFDSSDVIYLITPDRYANGDESNDSFENMNEQGIDRTKGYSRHGGDLKGIIDHLDYIEDMGYTSLWLNPVLTNDMLRASYHGYAQTDLYEVDPRYGTMEDYVKLSTLAKERGITMVMDQVANHIGLEHWWMKDLPFPNWINHQQKFENKEKMVITNHRRTINQDDYAAKIDKKGMDDGWFVSAMPDLNQRNHYMSRYLIQNSIWWIETLDLSGIRQDTYPYPDKNFMSKWAKAITKEYPDFSIVGEEWSLNPLLVAYWQAGHKNKDGYKSHMSSSMDFPMQRLIVEALNEKDTWGTGLVKIYEGLANDFAYTKPSDIMIFPGNHDMSRIYTQLGEDATKTKMAVGYILALPRIAQIYYGTEILMTDAAKPGDHGLIRSDFPGGWKGDKVNAFEGTGLRPDQKDMQHFMKKVMNYRKNSKAIHKGKTVHFAPNKGVYVMARMIKGEKVVVILNKNEQDIELDLSKYAELKLKGSQLRNIVSDKSLNWEDTLKLSKGILMLTTKK